MAGKPQRRPRGRPQADEPYEEIHVYLPVSIAKQLRDLASLSRRSITAQATVLIEAGLEAEA